MDKAIHNFKKFVANNIPSGNTVTDPYYVSKNWQSQVSKNWQSQVNNSGGGNHNAGVSDTNFNVFTKADFQDKGFFPR